MDEIILLIYEKLVFITPDNGKYFTYRLKAEYVFVMPGPD